MKNLLKSCLVFLLVIVLCFSMFACNNEEEKENIEESKVVEEDKKIEETSYYLVKDGSSNYVIVYPASTTSIHITTAIDELTLFFEKATGISLVAVKDSESNIVWSENAKYISLGETKLVNESKAGDGLDRKELKITGYAIKTVGQSVFLLGGRENGVLNAVYGFLHEQFNWECYAADEIVMDSNVKERKLLDFDKKVIPDISFNATAQTETSLNQIYARRLGMCPQDDFLIELGGSYYHNWLGTIPVETYYSAHSNWFSPDQAQLCLTRDKEGLAQEVLKKIIDVLKTNPRGYAIGFTQEDDAGWCNCSSCQACKVKYGTDAASQILFMNYLWDILEDWLKVNMPDREIYLYMFAYQSNTEPPKTDANGNLPEEMKLNEHIYVQYAPIYAAGYQSYDYKNANASDNTNYDNMFKGWQKVTNNLMAWTYSFYYKGLTAMYPYYDFSDMTETYNYLATNSVNYLFDEDHSGLCKKWSDWSRLKIYLRAKLAWDTDADITALTDSFFVNYYQQASKTMKQLFDEYSTYYSMIIQENNLRGQGGAIDILDTKLWPRELLDRWMRLFDQAFSDIEYLKSTDYETWQKLEERIRLDSISLRYLCESLYEDCIYVGNGNTILQDCRYFGISLLG